MKPSVALASILAVLRDASARLRFANRPVFRCVWQAVDLDGIDLDDIDQDIRVDVVPGAGARPGMVRMSGSRLADYLEHMRQAATDARGLVDGIEKTAFLADERTQQAVIMSLAIIGEVATKIHECYPDFSERHRTSLGAISDECVIASLGYFDISQEVVWDTVHTALPHLLLSLNTIDESHW